MEDSFYDNLLRATDNTNDITNEKYATVTKIEGKLVSVKEEDNEIEHSNVPILNNVKLGLGDKVVIGFVNNSIYNPILLGSLEHKASSGDDVSWDDIQDKPSSFPPSMHNHSITEVNNLVSSLNEKLNVEDAFSGRYTDLTNVPTSFNPSQHNHPISEVTNLESSLSAKLESSDVGAVALSNDYSDLDNIPSSFTPSSHSHGNLSNDGKVGSTSGRIITTTTGGAITSSSTIASTKMTNASALSNIGSAANATQSTINSNINTKLGQKANTSDLSEVATSGDYVDLTNTPTIPSKTSDLQNDSGFLTEHQSLINYIQKSQTVGLIKNDGTIDTTQYLSSLPSHNHDGRYYTESEMDSLLNNKLDVEDAFSGSYNDLSDVPTSFNPSSHNHSISDVSNLQTSLNAKLETGDVGSAALSNDYYDLDNLPSLFDGDYDSLTNKPSIPSKTSELTNDGDGTNVFVKNNDSRLSDSRTPTSHRASATTYGVGNASYYGHCRVINNLTKSSHTDGYALSAYQGYILKQDVDGKASSTHNHTKSDITDFPTLHTVATSGSYNDLLDKPNIPSGVVVDLNLDGTSNNAVANSAVVGGLNDKIEASDISFGFDADTKEIYIEVK